MRTGSYGLAVMHFKSLQPTGRRSAVLPTLWAGSHCWLHAQR